MMTGKERAGTVRTHLTAQYLLKRELPAMIKEASDKGYRDIYSMSISDSEFILGDDIIPSDRAFIPYRLFDKKKDMSESGHLLIRHKTRPVSLLNGLYLWFKAAVLQKIPPGYIYSPYDMKLYLLEVKEMPERESSEYTRYLSELLVRAAQDKVQLYDEKSIVRELLDMGTEKPEAQKALILYSRYKGIPIREIFNNYHIDNTPVEFERIKKGIFVGTDINKALAGKTSSMVIETHPDDGLIHMGMTLESLSHLLRPPVKDGYDIMKDLHEYFDSAKPVFVTAINDAAGVEDWQIEDLDMSDLPKGISTTDRDTIKSWLRKSESKENAKLLGLEDRHVNLDIQLPIKKAVRTSDGHLLSNFTDFAQPSKEDREKVDELVRQNPVDNYFMVFPFSNHPHHRMITALFLESIFKYNPDATIFFWADDKEFPQNDLEADLYLLFEHGDQKLKELEIFNGNKSQVERTRADGRGYEYYCEMSRKMSYQARIAAEVEMGGKQMEDLKDDHYYNLLRHPYAERFITVRLKPKPAEVVEPEKVSEPETDIKGNYTRMINETRNALLGRYASETISRFDELVKSADVDDELFEILYRFKDIPGINKMINRIHIDLSKGAIGAGTELIKAVELAQEGYEILALAMNAKAGRKHIVDIDIVAYREGRFYFFEVKSRKGKGGYNLTKRGQVEKLARKITKTDHRGVTVAHQIRSQLISRQDDLISRLKGARLSGDRLVSDNGRIILRTLSGVDKLLHRVSVPTFIDLNDEIKSERGEIVTADFIEEIKEDSIRTQVELVRDSVRAGTDDAQLDMMIAELGNAITVADKDGSIIEKDLMDIIEGVNTFLIPERYYINVASVYEAADRGLLLFRIDDTQMRMTGEGPVDVFILTQVTQTKKKLGYEGVSLDFTDHVVIVRDVIRDYYNDKIKVLFKEVSASAVLPASKQGMDSIGLTAFKIIASDMFKAGFTEYSEEERIRIMEETAIIHELEHEVMRRRFDLEGVTGPLRDLEHDLVYLHTIISADEPMYEIGDLVFMAEDNDKEIWSALWRLAGSDPSRAVRFDQDRGIDTNDMFSIQMNLQNILKMSKDQIREKTKAIYEIVYTEFLKEYKQRKDMPDTKIAEEDVIHEHVERIRNRIKHISDHTELDDMISKLEDIVRKKFDNKNMAPEEIIDVIKEINTFIISEGYYLATGSGFRKNIRGLLLYNIDDKKTRNTDEGPVEVLFLTLLTETTEKQQLAGVSTTYSDHILIFRDVIADFYNECVKNVFKGAMSFDPWRTSRFGLDEVVLIDFAGITGKLFEKGLKDYSEEKRIEVIEEATLIHELEHEVMRRRFGLSEDDVILRSLEEDLVNLHTIMTVKEPYNEIARLVYLAAQNVEEAWSVLWRIAGDDKTRAVRYDKTIGISVRDMNIVLSALREIEKMDKDELMNVISSAYEKTYNEFIEGYNKLGKSMVPSIGNVGRIVRADKDGFIFRDSKGRTHKVPLHDLGEFNISMLTYILESGLTIRGTETDDMYRKYIMAVLARFENSPPKLKVFRQLHDDRIGLASVAHKYIALHEKFVDNSDAQLHELLEYLLDDGAVSLKYIPGPFAFLNKFFNRIGLYDLNMFKDAKWFASTLTIRDANGDFLRDSEGNPIMESITLTGEALSIVQKNPKSNHYLARAFSRQVFPEDDKWFMEDIKTEVKTEVLAKSGWDILGAVRIAALFIVLSMLGGIISYFKPDDAKTEFINNLYSAEEDKTYGGFYLHAQRETEKELYNALRNGKLRLIMEPGTFERADSKDKRYYRIDMEYPHGSTTIKLKAVFVMGKYNTRRHGILIQGYKYNENILRWVEDDVVENMLWTAYKNKTRHGMHFHAIYSLESRGIYLFGVPEKATLRRVLENPLVWQFIRHPLLSDWRWLADMYEFEDAPTFGGYYSYARNVMMFINLTESDDNRGVFTLKGVFDGAMQVLSNKLKENTKQKAVIEDIKKHFSDNRYKHLRDKYKYSLHPELKAARDVFINIAYMNADKFPIYIDTVKLLVDQGFLPEWVYLDDKIVLNKDGSLKSAYFNFVLENLQKNFSELKQEYKYMKNRKPGIFGGINYNDFLTNDTKLAGSLPKSHWIHDIPSIVQKIDACHPTSLEIVLKYYGLSMDQDDVKDYEQILIDGGTRDSYILEYLDRRGLSSRYINADFNIMKEYIRRDVPVISSYWNPDGVTSHAVVCMGYDDAKSEFYFRDPQAGKLETIKYDEFRKIWDSDIIVVEPPTGVYISGEMKMDILRFLMFFGLIGTVAGARTLALRRRGRKKKLADMVRRWGTDWRELGPKLAEKIVDEVTHGGIDSLDDLLKVDGIDGRTLEAIKANTVLAESIEAMIAEEKAIRKLQMETAVTLPEFIKTKHSDPVKIDFNKPGFEEKAVKAVNDGRPLEIILSGYPEGASVETYRDMIKQIESLSDSLSENFSMDDADNEWYPIKELLKNAFVHGNRLRVDLPIYLSIELNERGHMDSVSVYDAAAEDRIDNTKREAAKAADLYGSKGGVKTIKRKWRYGRSLDIENMAGKKIGAEVIVSRPQLPAEVRPVKLTKEGQVKLDTALERINLLMPNVMIKGRMVNIPEVISNASIIITDDDIPSGKDTIYLKKEKVEWYTVPEIIQDIVYKAANIKPGITVPENVFAGMDDVSDTTIKYLSLLSHVEPEIVDDTWRSGVVIGLEAGIKPADIDGIFSSDTQETARQLLKTFEYTDETYREEKVETMSQVLENIDVQYLKARLKDLVNAARRSKHKGQLRILFSNLEEFADSKIMIHRDGDDVVVHMDMLDNVVTGSDIRALGNIIANNIGQDAIDLWDRVYNIMDAHELIARLKMDEKGIEDEMKNIDHSVGFPQRSGILEDLSKEDDEDIVSIFHTSGDTKDIRGYFQMRINNLDASDTVDRALSLGLEDEVTQIIQKAKLDADSIKFIDTVPQLTEGYISSFAVNPWYHRQGIGRKMFMKAVSEARWLGIKNIILEYDAQTPAEKFYMELGKEFPVISKVSSFYRDGTPTVTIIYDIANPLSRAPVHVRLANMVLGNIRSVLENSVFDLYSELKEKVDFESRRIRYQNDVLQQIAKEVGANKISTGLFGHFSLSDWQLIVPHKFTRAVVDLFEADRELAVKAMKILWAHQTSVINGEISQDAFEDNLISLGVSGDILKDELVPLALWFESYAIGIHDNDVLLAKHIARRLKGYDIDVITTIIRKARDIQKDFMEGQKRVVKTAPTGAISPDQVIKLFTKRPLVRGFLDIIRRLRNHVIGLPAMPSSIALIAAEGDFSRLTAYALGEQEAKSIIDILLDLINSINDTISGRSEYEFIDDLRDIKTIIEQT
ncbi:GNAT family N-acetyltransferase [Elusimicrobiota bacterium]